jgi:ribonuclease P/MRP protein subunit RPP20
MKDKGKRNKRPPFKPPTTETDIYVSKKTAIPAQLKRIEQLFEQGKSPVTIHGLGIAIINAIQLALRYRQEHPAVQWTVETSTVTLHDDVEPADVDDDIQVQTRNNSAIHIKLRMPIP